MIWWWATFQLCKSILWSVEFVLLLLTSPLCWPISSRADAGDLWEATWMHSRDVVRFISCHCWTLKPSQRQTARRQLSYSLCNTPWVLHTPLSSVQVPSVSLWSRNGFSGSRSLEETVNPECRSAGSHTSSALLSRSFDSVAFSEEPADFPLRWGENFRAPCQLVFSVFSWYSCFWAYVQLFFHRWIHLVWLLQQNLSTGINAHLSYL